MTQQELTANLTAARAAYAAHPGPIDDPTFIALREAYQAAAAAKNAR